MHTLSLCPAAGLDRPHRGPSTPPPPPDDERPGACGWFDSSHALQTGLRVTEHDDADAVVNLVPLSWWLAWELDAAMSAGPAPR